MKKRGQPEYKLCTGFMSMVGYAAQHHAPHFLIYHTPNGQRSGASVTSRKIQGARDKNAGALPGVYDYTALWLGVDNTACIGYLEAKAGSNNLTPEQRDFRDHLDAMGIPNRIFRTPGEGITALQDWGAISTDFSVIW